jgi:hypothetical protein
MSGKILIIPKDLALDKQFTPRAARFLKLSAIATEEKRLENPYQRVVS